MAARERTLFVLRAGIAANIQFSFVAPSAINVEVNASTFRRIINKIENDVLLVDDNAALLTDPRAVAEYHAANLSNHSTPWNRFWDNRYSGRLVISPTLGFFQDGAIIHESVHASFDLTLSNFPQLEEETAAYIAGAFYYKSIGFRFRPESPIYGKAQSLVESITGSLTAATVIPTSAVSTLIDEIGSQPLYMTRRGYLSYRHNG